MKSFLSPTHVLSGSDALDALGEHVARLGGKALVVADEGVRKAGLTDLVMEQLAAAKVVAEIFTGVESNPTVENVAAGHAAQRALGADVIVAVGGGSPIDAAKSVAVLATNPGSIADYEGFERLQQAPLPLIAIPTTVGTGSEVTKGAVITDHARHHKIIAVSNQMYPRVAFLDPRMVAGLPGGICAATGLDALTHAIEGYVATGQNAFSDALNLGAMELIATSLRPAVAGHLPSLHQMQLAAALAGAGFHNAGLGIGHALANTIGGHFNVHHGACNAILLPHVMRFNLIADVGRFTRIAVALGEPTVNLTPSRAAARAVAAVQELIEDVGIPSRLRDIGVAESSLETISQEALTQLDRPANPRRNNQRELLGLLQAAY